VLIIHGARSVPMMGMLAAPVGTFRVIPMQAVFSLVIVPPQPQPVPGPGTGGSAGLRRRPAPRYLPPKPIPVVYGYGDAQGVPAEVTARGTVTAPAPVTALGLVGARTGRVRTRGQVQASVVVGRLSARMVAGVVTAQVAILAPARGHGRARRLTVVGRVAGRVLDCTRGSGAARAVPTSARSTGQIAHSPVWELEELWLLGVGTAETEEELVLT
jgi:hypothetical protein